jgi:signal transduction histidine kinase
MQRHHWTYPPPTGSATDSRAASQRQLLTGSELAIRNHFSAIKGYSQLLERVTQQSDADGTRIPRYASALAQEVDAFQHLLQQYFDAAHLQWDDTAITWHAVDLGLLTRTVSEQFSAQAPPRDSRILHVASLDDVRGIWDQHWLSAAIAALISNALTYSPDGSDIHVTVRQEHEHAVIVISDSGQGITLDEREEIFQPFVRGMAAMEQGVRGWGLGLFIASRAVMAHGGWFEVDSSPGDGSQFILHLPLIPQHHADLPA